MVREPSTLTKTERHLWNAVVAEALAYLRYNAYAHKALEEGLPEIAQVFQEIAGAETIHGLNHLRVSGDIGTTLENLRTVTAGEAREINSKYPRMIRDAMEEGRDDAVRSFSLALERERYHLDEFARALETLKAREAGRQADHRGPSLTAEAPHSHAVYTAPPSTMGSGTVHADHPALSVTTEAPHSHAGYTAPPSTTEPGTVYADHPALSVTTEAPHSHAGYASQSSTAESQTVYMEGENLETYVTAAMEIDRERWRVASLGRLREVVFGAQDGILSTLALVTSVAVAVDQTSIVLVAGLAGGLAGMISMATGAYLGSKAEQDVRQAEIAREAAELETKPAEELAELTVIFQREGRSYDEARHLADDISQDKNLWLSTLVEKELGISPDETASPVKDALAMGGSFVLAAFVPIVPHMVLNGWTAIAVSVAAALSGLFVLGVGKGRLVQKSAILQGLEILAIGAVSAAIGYGLGDGIPRLFN